jgi:hypothetical protein
MMTTRYFVAVALLSAIKVWRCKAVMHQLGSEENAAT